jgi:hypothetical protein
MLTTGTQNAIFCFSCFLLLIEIKEASEQLFYNS